jgi:hypothetical protein
MDLPMGSAIDSLKKLEPFVEPRRDDAQLIVHLALVAHTARGMHVRDTSHKEMNERVNETPRRMQSRQWSGGAHAYWWRAKDELRDGVTRDFDVGERAHDVDLPVARHLSFLMRDQMLHRKLFTLVSAITIRVFVAFSMVYLVLPPCVAAACARCQYTLPWKHATPRRIAVAMAGHCHAHGARYTRHEAPN